MKQKKDSLEVRFWRKAIKGNGCWDWGGAIRGGYASMRDQSRQYQSAQRISWEIHFGKPDSRLKISTKCGSKICANPEHLQTGRACENQTFDEMFWKHVQKSSSCWIWSGEIDKDGYGRMQLPKSEKKRLSHRASWQINKGEIPKGLCVLHKCDVRSCVNPDHLFLGTNRDNSKDMIQKNRQAKGERVGNSVLTDKEVAEIRKIYKSNGHDLGSISNQFPRAKYATICDVVYRRHWKHLP